MKAWLRMGGLALLRGLAPAARTAPAAEEPAKRLRAQVVKVYDGSSFLVSPGMRATLSGVAAPAMGTAISCLTAALLLPGFWKYLPRMEGVRL
ncbi:MAG: hypothetical protein HYU38_05225, partial [Candidatus Tectomicrobia bacterium]|nr:hypothetical protein [Candidatus Tectomicrobia bacterium]